MEFELHASVVACVGTYMYRYSFCLMVALLSPWALWQWGDDKNSRSKSNSSTNSNGDIDGDVDSNAKKSSSITATKQRRR